MGGHRKYPIVKIGDKFDDRIVIRIIERDFTSNERVEWKCKCGVIGISYVFNLRKLKVCRHA